MSFDLKESVTIKPNKVSIEKQCSPGSIGGNNFKSNCKAKALAPILLSIC
jgi:hypothetical protein